jgi:hypothetical protein
VFIIVRSPRKMQATSGSRRDEALVPLRRQFRIGLDFVTPEELW